MPSLFEIAKAINSRITETQKDVLFQCKKELLLRSNLDSFDDPEITISIEDVADIAIYIVNQQPFKDGNHRTALELCYYVSLYYNNQLLRIKPYLLYSALSFERFKGEHSPDGQLFEDNAILTAIEARATQTIYWTQLKDEAYTSIQSKIDELPTLLRKIATPDLKVGQREHALMFAGNMRVFHTKSNATLSDFSDVNKSYLSGFSHLETDSRSTSPAELGFFSSIATTADEEKLKQPISSPAAVSDVWATESPVPTDVDVISTDVSKMLFISN